MRGLVAVQESKGLALTKDSDALYRQARDVYNHITNDGFRSGAVYRAVGSPQQLIELRLAFEALQKLADSHYGKAYFPLAIIYRGGQSMPFDEERTRHYRKMACDWCIANRHQNDPEIWNDLGTHWPLGEAVKKNGKLYWYQKAAESGLAQSQTNLGFMYSNARGVTRDYQQAMHWFCKAAEQGHPLAQVKVGQLYDLGRGAAQDYQQALFWFFKSAEQGHPLAYDELGSMYQIGRGVEQDDINALKWLYLARIGCIKDAGDSCLDLERRMTGSQIAEAQQGVSEWQQRAIKNMPSMQPMTASNGQAENPLGGVKNSLATGQFKK